MLFAIAAALPKRLGLPLSALGGLCTAPDAAGDALELLPKYWPKTICFLPAEFISSSMAALPSAVRSAISRAAGVDLRRPAGQQVREVAGQVPYSDTLDPPYDLHCVAPASSLALQC